MITYLHKGLAPFKIEVRLDGKRMGEIRRDDDGFYYRAKGGAEGERFPTEAECKSSLEADAA